MKTKIIDKNYGSIPHLSTSKLTQQADKKISLGQELIITKKTRDWKDLIIVTEKLDGSNVGIIKKDDKLIAITRTGYPAISSPYKQHILFDNYLQQNCDKFNWLPEGYRICGEFMIQAHGTIYDISKVEDIFVSFDIFDEYNNRILYINFIKFCFKYGISTVPLLHIGQPITIDRVLKILDKGHYGYPENPEGFVCRVERDNQVDFLAKWVRADKEDGKYLKGEEIWNKGIERWFKI
ncbi:MAG: RNA ligase family protein [Bryobacteraceae bacterium]